MDGGAWLAAVHEVAKSRTRLSDFAFTFHFDALEKEMATGWEGWMASRTQLDGITRHEPEQTQGDSEEQGSLVCCSSQACKELDMT